MQKYPHRMIKALLNLRTSDLVSLITTYAESDPAFREFIELRVESSDENNGDNLDQFKAAIDNTFGDNNLGPFLLPEKEARIDRLIDSIGELIDNGRSTDALEIVEHSFGYVKNIAESIMEPDYFLSSCFDDLIDIHKLACQRSGIDQEILAERIFTGLWQKSSISDVMVANYERVCYSPLIFFMEKACAANFRNTRVP